MSQTSGPRRRAWSVGVPQGVGLRIVDLIEFGIRADRAGFGSLGVGESADVDAGALLGALTQLTRDIRLDAAVLSPAVRSPALIAMSCATLGGLAPGRLTFSLGASSAMVAHWHGRSHSRSLQTIERTIDQLRGNHESNLPNDPGNFRLRGLPFVPVPIYLAAAGDRMASLAGRRADGLLLNCMSAEQAEVLIGVAKQVRTAAGVEAPLDVIAYCWVYVPNGDGHTEMIVRRALCARLATPSYRKLATKLAGGDAVGRALAYWSAGEVESALAALPDTLVEAVAVPCQSTALAACARRFRQRGCTTVRFAPLSTHRGDPTEAFEVLDAVDQAAQLAEPEGDHHIGRLNT